MQVGEGKGSVWWMCGFSAKKHVISGVEAVLYMPACFLWLTAVIRCRFSWVWWMKGWLTGSGVIRAEPHPPPSPTSLLLAMGHLTKIVQRQAEHVIGANPRLVNVLQDEALMESHDGVIICLDKAETQKLRRRISHTLCNTSLERRGIIKPELNNSNSVKQKHASFQTRVANFKAY